MPNLSSRDFYIESLAAPFDRWRLLMACVASALLGSIVVIGSQLGLVYLGSGSFDLFLLRLRFMSDVPAIFVGALVFQWCWMTGVTHASRRHLLTFLLHRNFWQCCAVSLVIALWLILVYIATRLAPAVFTPIIRTLPEGAMIPVFYTLAVGLVFLIVWLGVWVAMRLMLWSTFIVVAKKWRGPLSVWRSTVSCRRLLWGGSLAITVIFALGQFASWFVYWVILGNRMIVNGVPLGGGPTVDLSAVALIAFVIKISVGIVLFAAVCSGLLEVCRLTMAATEKRAAEASPA
jgi:hypothetical protein